MYASNGNRSASVIIDCKIDNLYYGKFLAVRDSHLPIDKGQITAFIGPSGCGKSTALRCLNRMNDLIRTFPLKGMCISGQDIYGAKVDPVVVRRYIAGVSTTNPFSMVSTTTWPSGLRLEQLQG